MGTAFPAVCLSPIHWLLSHSPEPLPERREDRLIENRGYGVSSCLPYSSEAHGCATSATPLITIFVPVSEMKRSQIAFVVLGDLGCERITPALWAIRLILVLEDI